MFRKEKVVCLLTLWLYDFYPVYPVRIIISSVHTFNKCTQFGDFYLVQELLSGSETFIRCGDFYPAQIILPSIDIFILFGHFYLAQ